MPAKYLLCKVIWPIEKSRFPTYSSVTFNGLLGKSKFWNVKYNIKCWCTCIKWGLSISPTRELIWDLEGREWGLGVIHYFLGSYSVLASANTIKGLSVVQSLKRQAKFTKNGNIFVTRGVETQKKQERLLRGKAVCGTQPILSKCWPLLFLH